MNINPVWEEQMRIRMFILVFVCLIPMALMADLSIVGSWEDIKENPHYPGTHDTLIFDANGNFTFSGPGAFTCTWKLVGTIIKLTDCGDAQNSNLKIIKLKDDRLTITFNSPQPRTYRRVAGSDTPGNEETPVTTGYTVKDHVQVEWNGQWYPAVILKLKGKKYLIHYDGYESKWDEWVGEDRMKR